MQRFIAPIALTCAALTGLSACATSDSMSRSEVLAELSEDPRVGEEVNRICFSRGIDSFNNEKRYSVVLRRAVDEEYLVVTRSCPDLERAQSMAIDGSGSCLRRFDGFRVFTSAFGPSAGDTPGFSRCIIDRIYRWDEDAIEAKADMDRQESREGDG